MSNRTISDEKEMKQRWAKLLDEMDKEGLDALFMYSSERCFSNYLTYVTDCPVVMYPLSGLFSKKGISLVGHGVKGVPLYPLPPEKMDKNTYAFHSGGVRQHDFIIDMIGVPSCPTTTYALDMWPETVAELINKYEYKTIGLVGRASIPTSFTEYFNKHLPDVKFTDATELVEKQKCSKSEYEMKECIKTVQIIDEILAAVPATIKVGHNIREIGRKLRAIADGYDCLGLNIMIGKHKSMPMFSDWMFTDEEVVEPGDYLEVMIEVSSNTGVWGECARVFSVGEPSEEMKAMAAKAFEAQDYAASLLKPGVIPSEVFEKYCDKLTEMGFPREQRFFCHGQGYDVCEAPFIRPENDVPFPDNAFIAIHPSMYDRPNNIGCFQCDNYMVTEEGAVRLTKTPREIIQVCELR